ncbi:MAG: carboxypeptidase-like regulatory domain-containing protein, partial [Crocinitomicaceae bacterium]
MKNLLILGFLFLTTFLFGQVPTQTVRGKVYDSETNYPLYGVKIEISISETNTLRCASIEDGSFEIKNVPIGKYDLSASLALYESKTVTIEVNSGKEMIVNIPLLERVSEKQEVKVVGRKKGEVINEMALISAQQFSVEETNRYPGSRMDPARMASNFAGVQGSDDSRNDIVVRGNSPLGVIYRVEGIDIPNPSHFAIAGSTGGPVSILNNKILGNSDFFMSAFPSEYGNSTSGVFDLKLRNGNNNQHEFTGQFGLFGTELLAEGPMDKKGNSSYLVMGRYSTLSIFQTLGIKIGTDAVPVYGDAAFKFNWKMKKGGNLSWWGMGGKSDIDIMISEQTKYSTEFYGEGDRDQYFGTSMYVSGLTYKKTLNEKTYISATLAGSREEQHTKHV